MPNAIKKLDGRELAEVTETMWARIDAAPKVVSVHPASRPRCKHPHINFMGRYRKLAAMYRQLFAVQERGLR